MPRGFGTTLGAAMPGMSRLAQALAGGGGYQDAYDKQLTAQSRLAQALSSVNAHNSQAALNEQKLADAKREADMQSPEALQRTAMLASGVPLGQAQNVGEYLQRGKMDAYDQQGQGPTMPRPDWSANLGALAQRLAGAQQVMAGGAKSAHDVAQAEGERRNSALSDEIIAGKLPRNTVAGAQAAAGGKPLFHFDQSGLVGDQYTGALDESSGRAVAVTGKERSLGAQAQAGARENDAQAGAARALGVAHLASADHSRAGTRKLDEETNQLRKAPKGHYDSDRGLVVDLTNGQSLPVMADGKPVGPKDKGAAKLTEDQGKATGWLIQATNAYGNMLKAIDPEKGTPSAAKPGINDAIAAVPGLGPLANTMRSADRQKFMQATSSLSEALLRAATGAGVNKDEAAQKVRELTPQFGDGADVRAQKMAAIPLYIESLRVRAGPGAQQAAAVVAPPASGFRYLGTEP